MTDPAGNHWSWGFDALGRQVRAVDPDTGTATSGYDAVGELTQTVDGAGNTLRYGYDALGRRTQVQQQLPNGGGLALLASWAYDTATLGKGLLAGSTSYVGSTAAAAGVQYTKTVGSYDQAGDLSAEIQPGGQALSDEYIAYSYDPLQNLIAVGGDSQYLGNVVFSHYNRPVQFVDTDGNGTVNHLYTYDDATARLTEQQSLSTASSNANLADTTTSTPTPGCSPATARPPPGSRPTPSATATTACRS